MPLAFFPQRGWVELKNRQAAGIAALASPRGWRAAAETQGDSLFSFSVAAQAVELDPGVESPPGTSPWMVTMTVIAQGPRGDPAGMFQQGGEGWVLATP